MRGDPSLFTVALMCLKTVYDLDLQDPADHAKYSSSLTLEVCI